MSWLRIGTTGGRPGNAHSGEVLLVSDEPYVGAEVFDWRCPRGVRPPTQLDTSGRCRLLTSTTSTPVDTDASLTYSGQVEASLSGTWDVAFTRWQSDQPGPTTYYQRHVNADLVRVGPLGRTVAHQVGDGYETETTTYTASMQLRGSVPGMTLPSPGFSQSSNWTRTTTRTRQVS